MLHLFAETSPMMLSSLMQNKNVMLVHADIHRYQYSYIENDTLAHKQEV